MEELLAQKKSIEKELDQFPKMAKARKARGANICGMVIFTITLMLFTLIMWILSYELYFDYISTRDCYNICFAFFAVVIPPVAVLGAGLLLGHKPGMLIAYVISGYAGWLVNIFVVVLLEDITPGDFRWWLDLWMVLGYIVFFGILPVILFALTFPPFKGDDPGFEEMANRKDALLGKYYYLCGQMDLVSPILAAEMFEKYEEYRTRRY